MKIGSLEFVQQDAAASRPSARSVSTAWRCAGLQRLQLGHPLAQRRHFGQQVGLGLRRLSPLSSRPFPSYFSGAVPRRQKLLPQPVNHHALAGRVIQIVPVLPAVARPLLEGAPHLVDGAGERRPV